MEIRKITPEERIYYTAINEQVFLDGQRWDVRAALKAPPENKGKSPVWAAFEKGKMLSAMVVHGYQWRMNGCEASMGGIGGVVTVPEARGRGLVRRLFAPAFDEMHESGQVYSFLYPFHFGYYRKFGYELCLPYHNAHVPLDQFEGFPYPQNLQPHEPADPHEPFAQIYEAFAQARNLSMVRSAENWQALLKRDPYLKRQFTYLNRAADNSPNAYLLYDADLKPEGNEINIRELCWATRDGLYNLLGFLGKMSAEYRSCRWRVPSDVNLQAILPNPYAVKWENKAVGMNRIVNVPAALAQIAPPQGQGAVTLEIQDAFRPDNNGSYRITWEGGHLTAVHNTCSTESADMAMQVTTLAQLVTGHITPREAQYRQDVTLAGDAEKLCALFPKRDLYLFERF